MLAYCSLQLWQNDNNWFTDWVIISCYDMISAIISPSVRMTLDIPAISYSQLLIGWCWPPHSDWLTGLMRYRPRCVTIFHHSKCESEQGRLLWPSHVRHDHTFVPFTSARSPDTDTVIKTPFKHLLHWSNSGKQQNWGFSTSTAISFSYHQK